MGRQKTALVLGAGGFIGSHLVIKLKDEGFWVRAVDLKYPVFFETVADEFIIGDLRDINVVKTVLDQKFDEVYQFAADMGGAGFVFTGDNDADIMYNSALINLHVLENCIKTNSKRIFYSSSACMYPLHNQMDFNNPNCEESSAYPANPDSEYGWEKLFSERLYQAFAKNYGIEARIARYHNIFGPCGTWQGGREKSPAALCRKVAMANDNESIDVWGTGEQTRSFLFIDECIEGTIRLMRSDCNYPINIGSDEAISINQLTKMIIDISKKDLTINNIDGPIGVNGRNSDNKLIYKTLNWKPTQPLITGIQSTYNWINSQILNK